MRENNIFVKDKINATLTLHFPRLSERIPLEIHVRLAKIAMQTGHTEGNKLRLDTNVNCNNVTFLMVFRVIRGILTPVPIELISQRKYANIGVNYQNMKNCLSSTTLRE